MTQTRTRIVSALAILLGVVMIGGGAMKLAAVPSQVTAFTLWGLPAWFRALVGTFEILGGALLVVSATRPASSLPPSIWSRAVKAARRMKGFQLWISATVLARSPISIRA